MATKKPKQVRKKTKVHTLRINRRKNSSEVTQQLPRLQTQAYAQECYFTSEIKAAIITAILVLIGAVIYFSAEDCAQRGESIPNCKSIGFHLIEKAYAKEPLYGEISMYNSEVAQTDDTPFIMASGKRVYEGAIACPEHLNFGTKLLIEGKTYTCEDRMAKHYRTGNYYDIWSPSKKEALNFGRQYLQVKIIQ